MTLSCSSVTVCSHLMPLHVRPGFHAQLHLVGQHSNFQCLSFRFLPSSIIPFHPTICVIFFCLKTLYCCSLLHSMTNYPSSHIFSAQKCTVTESRHYHMLCILFPHSSFKGVTLFSCFLLSSWRLTILVFLNSRNRNILRKHRNILSSKQHIQFYIT